MLLTFYLNRGRGNDNHADDTSNRYRITTALSARACLGECPKMSNKRLLLLDLIAFNRAETSISISAVNCRGDTHRVIHHH